jgi:uncharacterized protein (DUF302 family)
VPGSGSALRRCGLYSEAWGMLIAMPKLPDPKLPDHGLIHLSSPYSVPETLARLETILKSKGLAILARIDHSGDAAKAGLKMLPTELLIFGNAKSGTPLMIAAPTAAIDLPLKALVWQDVDGKVWLSYNSPDYLKERHAVPDSLLQNIAGIGPICEEAVRLRGH